MAQELTISLQLTYTKSPIAARSVVFSGTGDSATAAIMDNVQTIGTSEEALLLGDVVPGYCYFENLDSTNFVSIRNATGAASTVKIMPGKCAFFQISGSAPFAIADTAAVKLRCVIFNV